MGFSELSGCVSADWSPVIGDPTALGWLTVILYGIGCALTASACLKTNGRLQFFWLASFAFLLVLGINKQLDLQSALTAAGRCIAQAQGWYEERRSFQFKFILAVIVTSLAGLALLGWLMREHIRKIWTALVGLILLCAFVTVRAAGFHHFDEFIGREVGGVRINWIFEIGGLLLVCLNALLLVYHKGQTRRARWFW